MKLRRFVVLRVLLLAGCLCVLGALTLSRVYNWALDDSSEFYLRKDAAMAVKVWTRTGHLPEGDGTRAYYAGIGDLPEGERGAVAKAGLAVDQVALVESGGEILYILPFVLPGQAKPALALHRFTAEDDADAPGLSLSKVALLLSLLAAASALILAFGLLRAILRPVSALAAWAGQVGAGEPTPRLPERALRFDELKALESQLHGALQAQADSAQRERRYLQSLSHELRTPLAVTAATLDLLERQAEGPPPGWMGKLGRLRRANQAMRAMAEALLWVWREDGERPPAEPVPVKALVEGVWRDLQPQWRDGAFTLEANLDPDLQVQAPRALLAVVLTNLLRNALQYGAPGPIEITASPESLEVRNRTGSGECPLIGEAGFGVGLFLVERIADRSGWRFQVRTEKDHFIAALRLQ